MINNTSIETCPKPLYYPNTSTKNFPPVCKDFSAFTPINALNIDENPLPTEDAKTLTAYPEQFSKRVFATAN